MKNKKLYMSIGLLCLFIIGIMNVRGMEDIKDDPIHVESNLFPVTAGANMSSAFYDINTSIYIEGNWSATASAYDWCSGNGTEENPWIMENLNVTNDQKNAQIVIDTAEYFVMRNIIVSEYAAPYGHRTKAGIYIEKGEFGTIENCTITNCSTGLSIYEAKEEMKIINCDFIGSHNDSATGMGPAILIYEAKNVNITLNNIYAYYSGVVIHDSEECYIDDNTIEAIFEDIYVFVGNETVNETYIVPGLSDTGVYFDNVDDSAITNNDFYGCNATTQDDNYGDVSSSALSISSSYDYIPITINSNCHNITVYGNTFQGEGTNVIIISDDDDPLYWLYLVGIVCVCVAICFVILLKKKL